jgi:thiol-disulfide isomerase/thioredoxin
MQKKMKKSLICMAVFFISIASFSQHQQGTVLKLNFKEFEPYLQKNNDTLYVINFWATWCVPCREELPAFQEAYEKFTGQKVKIFLVSLDFPNQVDSRLIPFIKANNLKPEVILLDDPRQNEWIDKVDPQWTGAIPFTVIYGPGFRKSYPQPFKNDELYSIIQHKLKKNETHMF